MLTFDLSPFTQTGFISHSIVIRVKSDYSTVYEWLQDAMQQSEVLFEFELVSLETEGELLSIADVRDLQSFSSLRSDKPQVILVKAIKLPPVTQNSLLKLLEDGAENLIIILVTGLHTHLLPTVTSRAVIINEQGGETKTKEFASNSIPERLQLWDKYKDNSGIADYLNDLFMIAQKSDEIDLADKKFLHTVYLGWRKGVITNKYCFELLSIFISSSKLTTEADK